MRFLLCHILTGKAEPSSHVEQAIPDIHLVRDVALSKSRPNLVKSHFRLSASMPLLGCTERAVVLVRHPLDVVMSTARLFCRRSGGELSHYETKFLRSFVESGTPYSGPEWQGFGSWAEHPTTWLDQSQFPTRVIRYEDLRNDTAKVVESVCQFMRVAVSPDRIDHAIVDCSAEKMSKIEDRETELGARGIFTRGRAEDTQLKFVGGGADWRDHVTDEQRATIRDKYGAQMARFGYEV
ncbi:MAG: sulfotransferase domain-containing protein [Alphaproteobacteria bacterium]|nr:sulfotransferase domain-containing protein [Alphaproteobacteria bacterium]